MTRNQGGRDPGQHNPPAEQEVAIAQPGSSSRNKSLRPGQCRNYARKAMAKSLPKMLQTFIDRAEEGSVQHFNQLAKFSGFDQRPAPEPAKAPARSLARRLLDEMKEHESRMIAARDASRNAG